VLAQNGATTSSALAATSIWFPNGLAKLLGAGPLRLDRSACLASSATPPTRWDATRPGKRRANPNAASYAIARHGRTGWPRRPIRPRPRPEWRRKVTATSIGNPRRGQRVRPWRANALARQPRCIRRREVGVAAEGSTSVLSSLAQVHVDTLYGKIYNDVSNFASGYVPRSGHHLDVVTKPVAGETVSKEV
jgi:hypothetical protein